MYKSQFYILFSFSFFRLSPAVGALYIRNVFNSKSTPHVKQFFENIRGAFIDILNNVKWMDENTRKAAVDKAKAIVAHIAFPDELTNNMKLEEHYKSLTFNENEYFLNILRLKKFSIDNNFGRLYDPVNKTHWLQHAMPAVINAFYVLLENSIGKYSTIS